MHHRSPRALLWWGAAVATGVVAAASVAQVLGGLRSRDRAYGRAREIVVAARDLPLGVVVAKPDLSTLLRRGGDDGALRDARSVVGRVLRVPLLRGAPVTARHLAPASRDGRDGAVPPGLRAMRIVVGEGLRPEPGDHVDVLATFDAAKVPADTDPTLLVAPAAPVLAVDGPAPGDAGPGASGTDGAGVTLLVSPEQARRLAFATASGAVTLARVGPEDARATSEALADGGAGSGG